MSKKELAARMLVKTGAAALLLRLQRATQGILVLNYHRVGRPSDSLFDRALWSASAEELDRQVGLIRRHCDVISALQIDDARRTRHGRYVMLTFDDGYRDNYEIAFPILRRHGVSATFFVATGFLDRPRTPWWDEIAWMVRRSPRTQVAAGRFLQTPVGFDEPDRESAVGALLAAYKAMPGRSSDSFMDYLAEATGSGRCPQMAMGQSWMTWDMVRQMRDAGMCIGGHTVNHPILSRLSPEQQQEEISGCAARIAEELDQPMRYFAYPRGKPDAFNDATRACLKEAGVQYAFSYYGGMRRFDQSDPYDVQRCSIYMELAREQFQAMVSLPAVFA